MVFEQTISLPCILIIGTYAGYNVLTDSEVSLTSSLNQERVAFHGETITFTCTTRGSLILEWYSNEYIGTGGQKLQLRSFDCLNNPETSPSNPNTIARCVSVTGDSGPGEPVIVSELSIIASSLYPNATVNCTNNGLGSSNSTNFQTKIADDPLTLHVSDQVAFHEDRVTFTCTTRGSLILEWYSNEYIGTGGQKLQLSSNDCLNNPITSPSNPNTIARCINVTEESGVTMIVSELYITVSSESLHSNANITCVNNEQGTQESILVQILPATNTTESFKRTENGTSLREGSHLESRTLAIIISSTTTGTAGGSIIIVTLVISICVIKRKNRKMKCMFRNNKITSTLNVQGIKGNTKE